MELFETSNHLVLFLFIGALAGFIQSALGFGYGLIAIALLPLAIDARDTHLVVSISSVAVILFAAVAYRSGIDWKLQSTATLAALLFLPLGLYLFENMSGDVLVRATGAMILIVALREMFSHRLPATEGQESLVGCFAAGSVAGFLAGAVTIAGPPIAAYAAAQEWPPTRFKAFVIQFLFVVSVLKALGLVVGGQLHLAATTGAVLILPAGLIGIWLGKRATRNVSFQHFRVIVASALAAVALLLIIRGQP